MIVRYAKIIFGKRMEKFEKLLKGGSASSIEVSKVEFGTE